MLFDMLMWLVPCAVVYCQIARQRNAEQLKRFEHKMRRAAR